MSLRPDDSCRVIHIHVEGTEDVVMGYVATRCGPPLWTPQPYSGMIFATSCEGLAN